MRLVVGLPAFNEAETIRGVLQQIPNRIEGIQEIIVMVADDGSTDGTPEIAKNAGAVVIKHGHNRGLGMAFQTIVGFALKVNADILVTIDSDGQFDASDIPKLIAPLLAGEFEVSTASRFLNPATIPDMPYIKKWGNRRVARFVSTLIGKRYYDVSCGFRAYSREAMLWLTTYHSFTYTHEVFFDLASKNIAICEIPLRIHGRRSSGESKVASSVMRYGFHTALIILRTYRDWRPLRLCGYMSALLFFLGLSLLSISFVQVLLRGSWLKWAAFTGGACVGVGITLIFFGFMADMAKRLQRNQDETLYLLRRYVMRSECPHDGTTLSLKDITGMQNKTSQS